MRENICTPGTLQKADVQDNLKTHKLNKIENHINREAAMKKLINRESIKWSSGT